MATVYSLVCWGGKDGLTATMTIASPCVVTISDHGIRQYNGGTTPMTKGMQFTTTGTLPTGVTASTTYWARRINDDTFHLYDTEAHAIDTGSTTGRVNTSGTQSGIHTASGKYYNDLTSTELARYGESGSERIYGGISLWVTARTGNTTYANGEVLEVGESFSLQGVSQISISLGVASVTIHTYINGIRSEAFHGAVFGAGFILDASGIAINNNRVIIDGLSFIDNGGTAVRINPGYNLAVIKNNLMTEGAYGIDAYGQAHTFFNNIITAVTYRGIRIRAGNCAGCLNYNNTVSDAANEGINAVTDSYGSHFNNISVDSPNNWTTAPSTLEAAGFNAGESGDTNPPWSTDSNPSIVMATSDFADYANIDFAPDGAESPQVGTGIIVPFGEAVDILGKPRPALISITHTFSYDNEASGPFAEWDALSWGTGGTAGTGRLINLTDSGTTGSIEMHLMTGVAPTDGLQITNGTATCDVDGSVTTGEEWVESESWSLGAVEYDYGGPVALVDIDITAKDSSDLSVIPYCAIYIEAGATGGLTEGDVILSDTLDANGNIVSSFAYDGAAQSITGWIRKATSGIVYNEGIISGSITSTGFTADIILTEDI